MMEALIGLLIWGVIAVVWAVLTYPANRERLRDERERWEEEEEKWPDLDEEERDEERRKEEGAEREKRQDEEHRRGILNRKRFIAEEQAQRRKQADSEGRYCHGCGKMLLGCYGVL